MGNSVWTVEIIPAEIEPPARSTAGASGIRIRLGSSTISNAGDEADVVVAFNEQVLLGLHRHQSVPVYVVQRDASVRSNTLRFEDYSHLWPMLDQSP